MAQVISCPYCGKLTDPKLDNCPHCGGIVPHPVTGHRPVQTQELIGVPGSQAAQHCPNCGNAVQRSDIICVTCGTNLLTGQRLTVEEKAAAQRRSGSLWMAVGAIVLVLVLAAGAGVYYLINRDVVGRAVRVAASGNYQEAANTLSAYVSKHATDARAFFELGKVQWKLNQYPSAAQSFEQAVKNDPNNAEAAMLGALCLADVQGGRDRQLALLKKVLQTDPKNVDALRLTGLLTEDPGARVEALRRAVEVDPAVRAGLAIALALQGAQAEAAAELGQAGDDPVAAAAAGFVASVGGNNDAALDAFRRAASGAQPNVKAMTRLGMLLVAKGQYDEARKYLTGAMAVEKENPTVHFYYGLCLQASGLPVEAAKEFESAGQAAQGQTALAADAWLCAADLYVTSENVAKAQECLDRAAKAGSNSAGYYTTKARIASAAGDANSGRENVRKALQLDASYANAYLESGLLYVKQQLFTEGVRDLDRFLELAGPAQAGSPLDGIKALAEHLKQASGAPPAAKPALPGAPLPPGAGSGAPSVVPAPAGAAGGVI